MLIFGREKIKTDNNKQQQQNAQKEISKKLNT